MRKLIDRIKNLIAARVLAVVSVVLGLIGPVTGIVSLLAEGDGFSDMPSILLASTPIMLFSALFVYYGLHLFKNQTKDNIRCVTAMLSLFLVVVLLAEIFPVLRIDESLIVPIMFILFFPIYIPLTILTFKNQGFVPEKLDFFTSRTVTLTCLMICLIAGRVLLPIDNERNLDSEWTPLIGISTVVVALILNRVGQAYIKRLKIKKYPTPSDGLSS